MLETKEKAVEVIQNAIPYANQIKDYDFSKDGCIYFTWRGTRFKLSLSPLEVNSVENGMLLGCNVSLLLMKLIQLTCSKQ